MWLFSKWLCLARLGVFLFIAVFDHILCSRRSGAFSRSCAHAGRIWKPRFRLKINCPGMAPLWLGRMDSVASTQGRLPNNKCLNRGNSSVLYLELSNAFLHDWEFSCPPRREFIFCVQSIPSHVPVQGSQTICMSNRRFVFHRVC